KPMGNIMTTTIMPAHSRAVSLLAKSILEPDPVRAHQLAEQFGRIVADAAEEAAIRRHAAQMALLDSASDALDRAGAASGEERGWWVAGAGRGGGGGAARPSPMAAPSREGPRA